MAVIGIHASHEQIAPSELLAAMREAEVAGFERAWSSDHFTPWSERAWIEELDELGFDAIYLHHVGTEQRAFIEAFGEHVLPAVR